MRYGAAVIYNSKDSSNRETVYRYALHRAYGFPFKESADISKPDALFIPSGELARAAAARFRPVHKEDGWTLKTHAVCRANHQPGIALSKFLCFTMGSRLFSRRTTTRST
jgi:hypothetical protein